MKRICTRKVGLFCLVVLGLTAATPIALLAEVRVNWSLQAGDPFCPHRPGCHEQVHKVLLRAGTTYVINMRSNAIDSYLYLEDSNRKVVAQDDDSGGNLNARIIFTPVQGGWYYVVATSFRQAETGAYTMDITP